MAMILSDNYAIHSMRSGCIFCANGNPRQRPTGLEKILTTDFEDDVVGVPEICQTCLEEAGRLVGMVSGPKFAQVSAELKEAQDQLKEALAEIEDKTATVRVLTKELEAATRETVKA